MAADSIQLVIDYENGNLKFVSKEAEDELSSSGKKSGKQFSNNFTKSINASGGVKSLLGTIGKIGAAAAAVGSVALFKSVKDAATLEVINTQFEVMLKSSSAAQKQVEELQDFAASTPFQLTGLAEATKQLLSFGTAQKDIIPTLTQLGDIAAGVGADITDLTIPFGRLVSTQKLTLQELDKFADRGVNIYAELAKQTGTSLKDIRDDISRGKIPFEEFNKALTNMTGKSGLFFKGMEKQSKTLTGVMSTLADNLFNVSANFGKAFSPVVIKIANDVIKVIKDVNKEITESFNVFEDVLNPLIAVNEAIITYVIAPLELLGNIGVTVFDLLVSGVATTVAAFGQLGGTIGSLLSKFGIADELSQGLQDFADTSAATAAEAALKVGESASSILDFDASTKLAQKNEELRAYFQTQREIVAVEGTATKEVLDAQVTGVGETSQTFAAMLVGTFKEVEIGITQTKKQMAVAAKQTASIVKNGLAKGISGGIQNIATSLAKGEDVFANFGNFLLGTIGDLAIQLGSFFIAQGIAVQAMEAVQPGSGAIVAGAALVAVGSLLKAASGGGGASASTGGGAGGGGGALASQAEPTSEFIEEAGGVSAPQTVLNINVEGNIRDDAAFTRQLVEDIGTEGGKQGLVFDNFATV